MKNMYNDFMNMTILEKFVTVMIIAILISMVITAWYNR